MSRQTGIQTGTCDKIFIDAGAVYKNYGEAGEALLGATRGGNVFKVETEIREMELDGAHGPVKSGKRIVTVTASITANFVEMTKNLLLLTQPGAVAADYPAAPATKTHDLITRSTDIADSDYLTNVAIVGNITGSATRYVIVQLDNVLADGNLEIGFNDKDESVVPVNFTGHFLETSLDSEPWKVYYPNVS